MAVINILLKTGSHILCHDCDAHPSILSELSSGYTGGRIQDHTQAFYFIYFLPPLPPPPSLHLSIHPPSLCHKPHPCSPSQAFANVVSHKHTLCSCTAYGILLLCLVVSISHLSVTPTEWLMFTPQPPSSLLNTMHLF